MPATYMCLMYINSLVMRSGIGTHHGSARVVIRSSYVRAMDGGDGES